MNWFAHLSWSQAALAAILALLALALTLAIGLGRRPPMARYVRLPKPRHEAERTCYRWKP